MSTMRIFRKMFFNKKKLKSTIHILIVLRGNLRNITLSIRRELGELESVLHVCVSLFGRVPNFDFKKFISM